MHLTHLALKNFRNYAGTELTLGPGLTVFRGGNAQGKSNLLEAVAMLALTKSTRAEQERDVIRFASLEETPYTRVSGTAERRGGATVEVQVDMALAPGERGALIFQKRLRVDGVPKPAGQAVGAIAAVLFSAEDLSIVTGSPANRRRYLDVLLSQADRGYLRALQQYQRVITQRNQLLAAHPRGAGPHAGVGLLGRRAVPPRRAGHGAAAGRRRRARAGERRCLCGHGGGRRPLRGRIRAEHRPCWASGRGRGPRHGPARRATAAGGADGAEPRGPAPRRPSIDRRRAGRGAVWVAWAGEDCGALASAGGGHLPASRDGRGAGAAAWTMCSRSWTGSVDSTCWRRRAARSRRWSRWSRERSRPACTRPSRRTRWRPARCT